MHKNPAILLCHAPTLGIAFFQKCGTIRKTEQIISVRRNFGMGKTQRYQAAVVGQKSRTVSLAKAEKASASKASGAGIHFFCLRTLGSWGLPADLFMRYKSPNGDLFFYEVIL